MTHYNDVALEAALLCDVRAARRFVRHELGPLTSEDARTRVLRDTLGSYLQSGLNAAATAAVLNVSDRTVAYGFTASRTSSARVLARSSELAAAIRLHRVLNS